MGGSVEPVGIVEPTGARGDGGSVEPVGSRLFEYPNKPPGTCLSTQAADLAKCLTMFYADGVHAPAEKNKKGDFVSTTISPPIRQTIRQKGPTGPTGPTRPTGSTSPIGPLGSAPTRPQWVHALHPLHGRRDTYDPPGANRSPKDHHPLVGL